MSESIAIVGAGRMGLSLASAWLAGGDVSEVTFFGRRPEPPSHPLFNQGRARWVFGAHPVEPGTTAVVLAVPDGAIPEMAHMVAAQGPAPVGCAAFHLSAATPTDVLAPLHAAGYPVGSFHPLQVVSRPLTDWERLRGVSVAAVGSPEAMAVARRLASALDGRLLPVPASRLPLVHAAATLASTAVPVVMDLAVRLMARSGAQEDEALAVLIPLARATLDRIEEGGVAEAFEGPIAEGDVETVALHMRAMELEERSAYATLGRELVRVAAPALSEEAREGLNEVFERNG